MQLFEYEALGEITLYWDVAFHGTHADQRDCKIKNLLETNCKSVLNINYDRQEMQLVIGGQAFELYELTEVFELLQGQNILIDSTSLDVAELAVLAVELKKAGISDFDVIYAEPEKYSHNSKNGEKIFNLSEKMLGFEEAGIPGISRAIPVDEPRLFIFLMGYEGERFKNALEISELSYGECNLIFGVPAFQFGWEKNSLLSSARAVLENNLQDSLFFCGATNINGIYRTLEDLRKKHRNELFFLIPLGPKPMSVGAIRFLCNDDNTALLYDHPARSANRSSGIGKIHVARSFLA